MRISGDNNIGFHVNLFTRFLAGRHVLCIPAWCQTELQKNDGAYTLAKD